MAPPHPRVLITTAAALGHFHPLAAVATALRERGAHVKFACSPGFCRHIVASGFDAVPCGMDWQSRDLSETWPEFGRVPLDERNSWINSVLWAQRLPDAMIPDLIEAVEQWKPSLVLSGRAELAGPTVGELLGVPYASASAGRVIGLAQFIAETSCGRNELRRQLGLEPDPSGSSLYRHLYLNFIPDMFQPDKNLALPAWHDLQPALFDDPLGSPADWLAGLGPGSVIYVTLGSILGEIWAGVFPLVIDAVRDLGYTVVVTVGPKGDAEAVASRFADVHVAKYIPQRFVLDHAALVICHGGINTLLGALSCGIPVLVLPTEQSDQRWNAERCARRGAGLYLDIDSADRASIRRAASALLHDRSFQRSARACMREIRQLPPSGRAADLLLHLAAAPRQPGEGHKRPGAGPLTTAPARRAGDTPPRQITP
jgi:MGT family glycosyltransferase